MSKYEGSCHCGNLSYIFETPKGLENLQLRACMCAFCRKHGQRSASDPEGRVKVAVKNPAKLTRYRFNMNVTDFLVCKNCGVYIGAMMTDKEGSWMTINVNSLHKSPPPDYPVKPHNFDAEDLSDRVARRKSVWTPVSEFTEGKA